MDTDKRIKEKLDREKTIDLILEKANEVKNSLYHQEILATSNVYLVEVCEHLGIDEVYVD